ncbi:MAG: hypothetical protein IT522_14520 [Burkholderiales bacterium]|nr:hypothetical protein [Burkholderiales bacterium]
MTPAAGVAADGLLPAAVIVPFAGMLFALVLGGRRAVWVAAATIAAGGAIAVVIARQWWAIQGTLTYFLGGWAPPLGIALRADGPAVAMMAGIAVVIAGIAVYARADFGAPAGARETRSSLVYWLLLLSIFASLNLAFLSGDLFTLYVALELLTFSAVPLVCLDGKGETLRAALRYLVFALAGSIFYLLGAVLLYGAFGTLDIALLAARMQPGSTPWLALAMMTAGLLAKTALFPLHLWLPPAHAGAPPAASAILSALVVKGSWFIVIRLWFDVAPALAGPAAAQLLGSLGAAAIVVGSVLALRQERLKLLVAYSTLAQIGYLFLMFPLGYDASGAFVRGGALDAGVLQALAHATAKAAMFMAAGLLYKAYGHDRLGELTGAGRAMPVTVLAFVVGGVALMGVLPSGAYLAKKLLLASAAASAQWWWDVVLTAGGFLTASYVVLVTVRALRRPPADATPPAAVPRSQELAALTLALCSFALAWVAVAGPLPASLVKNPLAPSEFAWLMTTVVVGALLALGFAREAPFAAGAGAVRALRAVCAPVGRALEAIDYALRGWSVASLSLVLVTLAFALLMRTHG